MCYPCTMCNGCGKLDSELFAHMIPKLRCQACGAELDLSQDNCGACGLPLPAPPGESLESRRETGRRADSSPVSAQKA